MTSNRDALLTVVGIAALDKPSGLRAQVSNNRVITLRERWKLSERKACQIARISHTVVRYKKRPDRNVLLRKKLRQLAAKYSRFDVPMLFMTLRNEGWHVNHKRVERVVSPGKTGTPAEA